MFLNQLLKSFIQVGTLRIIDSHGKTYVYSGSPGKNVTIKLHNKKIKHQLFWQSELALGEGYMNGAITIEQGDLRDLLDLCTQNLSLNAHHASLTQKIAFLFSKFSCYFQQYNPLSLSRRYISHHYDMNQEFIQLFLDRDLQYSCAYFNNIEEDTLEKAQENKKYHISKKLLLQPGQRVLDIGSGWGGMALYLAKHANVEVTGLTLSKDQYMIATERAKQAGLSDRVKFYLRDYREEKNKYDRIVSVGMFEHVGTPHFQTYFNQAYNLLNDDGIMLLHAIGATSSPRPTNPWIRKYIFPGGYCPSLSEVFPTVEKSKLIVTDMEILHNHYAETLKHWRERFLNNWDKAKNLYNETFCRMWEYYLTSCETAFRNQDLMIFQIQLTRNKNNVPSTRDYLYKNSI